MIKWGVIGTADIAKWCGIPAIIEAGNAIPYAIAGRNPDKVNDFKEKFGFEKTYLSYDELLQDPDVEAVYIPLPNHIHFEWTKKAIEAGKHVLCEKPFVPTAKEARELFTLAKEKHVIVAEAFAYLQSPYVDALKAEIESDTIGSVRYIETEFLSSEYSLSNIRMHKEYFGGALYDLGCYCTSLITTIINKTPISVTGTAEYTKEGIDTLTIATMDWGDGVRGSLRCGMVLGDGGNRFDHLFIRGSKGYIKSDVAYNEAGELKYTVFADGKETVKTVYADNNYMLEIRNIGECIKSGTIPKVSAEFSIKNAELMDMLVAAIGY